MSARLVEVNENLGVALDASATIADGSVVMQESHGFLGNEVDGSVWSGLGFEVSLQSSWASQCLRSGLLGLGPGLDSIGRLVLDGVGLVLLRKRQGLLCGEGG